MEKFTFQSVTGFREVTYYEINFKWNEEHLQTLLDYLTRFSQLELIFSDQLNHLNYQQLMAERERYEIEHPNPELKNPEKSLKEFYGTFQMRAWQPDEIYDKFQSIYKLHLKGRRIASLSTKEAGVVSVPEELHELGKPNVVVALTVEGELKTYLVIDTRRVETLEFVEATQILFKFINGVESLMKENPTDTLELIEDSIARLTKLKGEL